MLAPTLLLSLSAALGTPGDAAAPLPAGRPLPLHEALEVQGAPGMMDLQPQSYGQSTAKSGRSRWTQGHTLMQGYFGALMLDQVETTGGGVPPTDSSDGDLNQMPTIGGGGMTKMGGNNFDWGLEGMIGFSGRANATAFHFGGGGAAIAVDVDLMIIDLYGGIFVSKFLGDKFRIYGALGPMLSWADYDQDGTSPSDSGNGSGFGIGGYVRAGLDIVVGNGTLVGIAGRWSDSQVDLSGDVGDLDVSGVQAVLTITTGL